MLKKLLSLTRLSLLNTSFLTATLASKIVVDLSIPALIKETNAEEEIPPDFYKIENNILYGFADNVTQPMLYNGRYTIANIPSGVEEIADYAFASMFDGLDCLVNTLIIPPTVKKIGNYTFFRCPAIQQIVFDSTKELPISIEKIGKNAFEYCGITGKLDLPESLKELGDRAFYNCGGLDNELVLPANLQQVGEFAFTNCECISSINLLAYKQIPSWMFKYQSAFRGLGSKAVGSKKVLVNTDVNSEDEWQQVVMTRQDLGGGSGPQFTIESQWKKKEVPSDKFKIERDDEGTMTLYGFTSPDDIPDLTQYNTLTIPNNVMKINKNAFYDTDNQKGYLVNCSLILDIQANGLIVDEGAFRGCTGLIQIKNDTSMIQIGKNAFRDCNRIAGPLTLGAGKVDVSAFENCSSFTELKIPLVTETINERAFYGCSGIQLLDLQEFENDPPPMDWYFDESLSDDQRPFLNWGTTGMVFLNPYNKDHKQEWLTKLQQWGINTQNGGWKVNTDEGVLIPEGDIIYTHNNSLARGFTNAAKSVLTTFNTIVFQDRTQEIYDFAFDGQLKTELYPNSFWDLALNFGLQKVDKNAFANDDCLRYCYYWPDSLSVIDDNAFYNCNHLWGTISIPNSLIRLGDNAFFNCEGLSASSVVFPRSTQYIGQNALKYVKLKSIKLCQFTGTIKEEAFAGNDLLTTIDLTDYDDVPTTVWTTTSTSFSISQITGTVLIKNGDPNAWHTYLTQIGLPSTWTVQKVG